MGIVLALLLAAVGSAGTPPSVGPDVSCTVFEAAAVAWRDFAVRCWGVENPPTRLEARLAGRRIYQSVAELAPRLDIRVSQATARDLALVLRQTENEGREAGVPSDPSYGGFGVTIPAARSTAARIGIALPASDLVLARLLERDRDLNARLGVAELMLRLSEVRGRTERAVLAYKLGSRGNFSGTAARRRLDHFRRVRSAFRCFRAQYAEGRLRDCECAR